MPLKDYPQVPTALKQILTTTGIIVLCSIGFFFLNFDFGFSADTKRLLTRIGGWVILGGGLLGGFGFLWNKKNKIKLTMAQQDFNSNSIAVETLIKANGNNVNTDIAKLQNEIKEAKAAIVAATSFEDTVAKVGIFALVLLTLGTFLQVIAT